MTYLHIFAELKKVLRDAYDINTDDGIKELAKLIHDFQEKGYDAAKIIKEYKNSLSLKLEIKENQDKINELYEQKNSLQKSSFILRVPGKHAQANHECVLGTGSNEVWDSRVKTDMEHHFGDCRGQKGAMSSQEAVSLFIMDIEENYHDKFLLEDKVKEKRKELFQTEQELNNNRMALQLAPFVGTTLQRLFQNGISENDIISINQIVTESASDKLQPDLQSEGNKDSTIRAEGSLMQ